MKDDALHSCYYEVNPFHSATFVLPFRIVGLLAGATNRKICYD